MFIVALEQQNPRKNSNVIIVEKTIALVYLYNGHSIYIIYIIFYILYIYYIIYIIFI